MTLLELRQSTSAVERLRGTVLSAESLTKWVNTQIANDFGLHFTKSHSYVDAWLDFAFMDSLDKLGSLPFSVVPLQEGMTYNQSIFDPYFGSKSFVAPDLRDDNRTWRLNIEDWPLLTVELVTFSLQVQGYDGKTFVPNLVQRHLPRFFPNTDYLELQNWYRNDLLSLNSKESSVPFIADVMLNQNIQQSMVDNLLPGDFIR